jgi:hypothetical protein
MSLKWYWSCKVSKIFLVDNVDSSIRNAEFHLVDTFSEGYCLHLIPTCRTIL